MFASFTGRDNSRQELDPFASDSRLIHDAGEQGVSAIGDSEPSKLSKRPKGKSASGTIKVQDTGSSTGTVLRGFRDALKEKLDSQLETREVKHNTRVNRSRFSASEVLQELEALQSDEPVTPRSGRNKTENLVGLQASFTFSYTSDTGPRSSTEIGTRFVETVQVRTVIDNGTDIWYEHSEMAIDYTTRKHVLTFEAHNVGEVNECDLLV